MLDHVDRLGHYACVHLLDLGQTKEKCGNKGTQDDILNKKTHELTMDWSSFIGKEEKSKLTIDPDTN